MSAAPTPPSLAEPLASLAGLAEAAGGDRNACCTAVYAHPVVRWLLGGELHPGGAATTLRALELACVRPGDRLLDVASGAGDSALLAARELGCDVVGLEYGETAVRAAAASAEAEGLGRRVRFSRGDAESLPFDSGEFDAVLCECSLCTFADKPTAVAEMRRVLRRGGRLALADVVVDPARLPARLAGPLATIACVGEALPHAGYESLLAEGGLRVTAAESHHEAAAALALRVEDRLRGARMLGLEGLDGPPFGIAEAIELAGVARGAIAAGALGYAIFAARR
jgi:arsenite methyltransferase